ncbi:MANS1 protein, partial [Oreotrochilus melanogaster]|nr:MANS1 protein [Oreotrochilus melanogaster]
LLVITCVMSGPSLGQECSAEKKENVIVDINLALAKGVGGTEPVHAATPEACVQRCCSGETLSGGKMCNLVIFNAQRTSVYPTCYLFYCPGTEACPMKSATGYVSYKITREIRAPENTSFESEDSFSNEYSLSSDAGAFISHSQTSPQKPTAAVQQSVSQPSELPNSMAKHLDNSEFHTAFPESQQAKHPESLDPTPRQKVMNLPSNPSPAVQIGNLSASFPTTQSPVPEPSSTILTPLPTSTSQLELQTTSLPTGGAKPPAVTTTFLPAAGRDKPATPDTTIAVTPLPLSSPTASASTTKQVTTSSRSATTLPGLRTPAIPLETTIVSSKNTSQVTFLSSSGFTLPSSGCPTASQNIPQGYDPPDSESYLPEGVLREKGVIQLEEKSSLIAALLFGVIFFLLVIALTGKKIRESLQKRHYTRLDYLINGIYADV